MRDREESTNLDPAQVGVTLNRRRALQCMAWAGAGVVWTLSGGVPRSLPLGSQAFAAAVNSGGGSDFLFAQISDSHIGFKKDANPDPAATLQVALDKLKVLQPAFVIHTGDVSHLSKPEEFDTAEQMIRGAGFDTHFVPGEHDMLIDNGKPFFQRFVTESQRGWYSFDYNGVHFVALVNVFDLKEGGLGTLGSEQLEWLERDLRNKTASTPIVVFTHIPLWSVYPDWGWGTVDSAQALTYLRRFGSVTVLNGHIHQVLQKVEGHVAFHTAASTAFPQPAPGQGPGPGPLKVPAEKLRSVLGVRHINVVAGRERLAVVDTPLDSAIVAETPRSDVFSQSVFFGD
ncbi:MAG TPA: metallophosphoesterase [Spongiibacteraceae bacterium]|nr:metallophosphoesterase [Spongiibacteraceae bacterium]